MPLAAPGVELEGLSLACSSHKMLYPDLIVWVPSLLFSQMRISSWAIVLMGMAFTFLAITYEFHQPVWRSIRSATTTSEGRKEIGDIALLSLSPSNHRSPYTRIFFPSLTLHFACILIIFLAFRMLFQAKEPEIDFASKIEEVGKYLALKEILHHGLVTKSVLLA